MTLATKSGAFIVKDGKLATDCSCCGGSGCYALFEWIDDPPPTALPAFGAAGDPRSSRDNEPGFCVCYWKPGVALTCNASTDVLDIVNPGLNGAIRFEGYLPKGGALHSRIPAKVDVSLGFVIANENLVGRDGSLSGLAATVGGSPGALSVSSLADAPARIVVTESSLFLFPPQRVGVRIGLHASGQGTTVLEGATIANPFTGTGSYRYRIVRQTEQQFLDVMNATAGRSLKDCDSNDLWSSPWSAEVEWPPVAPSALQKAFWFGVANSNPNVDYAWFFDNAFQSVTSFSLEASDPVVSSNGKILAYRKEPQQADDPTEAPLLQWSIGSGSFLDVCVGNNGPVTPFTFGGQLDSHQHLGGSACNGCQTRYNVSGVVRRVFVQRRTNPYSLDSMTWFDTLYFDNVLTTCLNSTQGVSFTVSPTRRILDDFHQINGVRYGAVAALGDLSQCLLTVTINE